MPLPDWLPALRRRHHDLVKILRLCLCGSAAGLLCCPVPGEGQQLDGAGESPLKFSSGLQWAYLTRYDPSGHLGAVEVLAEDAQP